MVAGKVPGPRVVLATAAVNLAGPRDRVGGLVTPYSRPSARAVEGFVNKMEGAAEARVRCDWPGAARWP
jgi:hypothetical protein